MIEKEEFNCANLSQFSLIPAEHLLFIISFPDSSVNSGFMIVANLSRTVNLQFWNFHLNSFRPLLVRDDSPARSLLRRQLKRIRLVQAALSFCRPSSFRRARLSAEFGTKRFQRGGSATVFRPFPTIHPADHRRLGATIFIKNFKNH